MQAFSFSLNGTMAGHSKIKYPHISSSPFLAIPIPACSSIHASILTCHSRGKLLPDGLLIKPFFANMTDKGITVPKNVLNVSFTKLLFGHRSFPSMSIIQITRQRTLIMGDPNRPVVVLM